MEVMLMPPDYEPPYIDDDDSDFFRGLMWGVPLGAAIWTALIFALLWWL
jgi:hypothetical protein